MFTFGGNTLLLNGGGTKAGIQESAAQTATSTAAATNFIMAATATTLPFTTRTKATYYDNDAVSRPTSAIFENAAYLFQSSFSTSTSSPSQERSSSSSERRPRVSFRDEVAIDIDSSSSDVVADTFPTYSHDEYDREPWAEVDMGTMDAAIICMHLRAYLENEMEVHPSMRHTVTHAHLYGKQYKTQHEIRMRVTEMRVAKLCGRDVHVGFPRSSKNSSKLGRL